MNYVKTRCTVTAKIAKGENCKWKLNCKSEKRWNESTDKKFNASNQ